MTAYLRSEKPALASRDRGVFGRRGLIVRYLSPRWRSVAMLTLLLTGGIGLQVAEPRVIAYIIETMQSEIAYSTLVALAGTYLGVSFLRHVLQVLSIRASEQVAWSATNSLRSDLMAHVMRLGPEFRASHPSGEVIERVDGDVNEVAELFSTVIIRLIGNAILAFGIVVSLALVDPMLGALFAVLVLGGMFALRWVGARAGIHWTRNREMSAKFFGYVSESVRGAEDLRSLGAVPYAMARLLRYLRSWMPVSVRAQTWGAAVWIVVSAVLALGTALAYGLGGSMYQAGSITLGDVYLLVAYAAMLTGPLEAIQEQTEYLQQASGSIRRIADLFAVPGRHGGGTRTLQPHSLPIEFRNVTFHYPSTAEDDHLKVDEHHFGIRGMSFKLGAGERLGVVGRTGAGKTTIAQLLFRSYDPMEGQILIGGANISDVELTNLRSRIGYVPQDVDILNASVRDNLVFFDKTVSDKRLMDILHSLGLEEWLSELPDGLDTRLSHTSLSAGQAQLVALGRVFIKDPSLVILDEPSSRLDPGTEAQLQHALETLLEGRTSILIAHRLGTIHRTDRVLVVDKGAIVEQGPTEELLDTPASRLSELRRIGEVQE